MSSLELQLIAGVAVASVSTGLGWAAAGHLREAFARRVLIAGTGAIASMLIEEIESARPPRYVVAGVGPVDQLASLIETLKPTHIVLADDRRETLPCDVLLQCRARGVIVEDALDFHERLTGTVAIEAVSPDRLVLAPGFRNSGVSAAVARAISVSVAIAGLIALAPMLAVVALAIKLDSPGPVLFVQRRIGLDGRAFPLLKFRTMRACQEHRTEWVRDNEDRITRLGRWLRRTRIDEVPQLVNVLRGEMNLIGPRPHPTCNGDLFEKAIAFYRLRSAVLPGITGWAQVRYGYANTLEEEVEKMRYDLYYIKNRSLALDGRIVVETIGVLLWGRGATTVQRPPGCHRLSPPSKPPRAAARAMPAVTFSTAGRS